MRPPGKISLLEFIPTVFPSWEFAFHNDVLIKELQEFADGELKRLMIFMPPRHGKLIADSTAVLTLEGWKDHGDLQEGDYVVHPSGRFVKVIATSAPDEATLAVTLTNGEVVKCHPNHEWTVYDRSIAQWRVLETKQLRERTLQSEGRSVFQLPLVEAVDFPTKDLPMSPYVLGAWLGDGSRGKSAITHSSKDRAVVDRITSLGYGVSSVQIHKKTGVVTTCFGGVKGVGGRMYKELKEAGVYNEKHIPEEYKLASIEQKLELLAGLIDTDGHVDDKGRVRIVTVSDKLRDDIMDIATSLGFRPYCHSQEPSVSTSEIQGRKPVHYVGFQPTREIPTALSRKRIPRIVSQRRIGIKSIESCLPEKGKCIQVDSEDGLYCVGRSLVPTHNSLLCSIILPAYLFYLYPGQNVMLLTYGHDLSTGFGGKVRDILRTEMWQNLAETTIRKDTRGKNHFQLNSGSEFFALGRDGAVTGKGTNWLLCDDMVKGRSEADSPKTREDTLGTYKTVASTRLNDQNAAILHLITRWRKNDLPGTLISEDKKRPEHLKQGWKVVRMPAIAEEEEHWEGASGNHYVRKKGEALWPERYDRAALESIREELGPEFTGMYQQRPSAVEGEIFKRDNWVFYEPEQLPPREDIKCVLVSLDTAFKTKEASDYTVGLVGLIGMDGHLYLLNLFRMKVEFNDLKSYTKELIMLYQPDWVLIEDKGSGTSLYQELVDDPATSFISGIEPIGKKWDKRENAQACKALQERHKVLLPKDPTEPEAYSLRTRGKYEESLWVCGLRASEATLSEDPGDAMIYPSEAAATLHTEKLAGRIKELEDAGEKEEAQEMSKNFGNLEIVQRQFDWWDEDWVFFFVEELAEFPNGDHDDQVDSFTQMAMFGRKHKFFDAGYDDMELLGVG